MDPIVSLTTICSTGMARHLVNCDVLKQRFSSDTNLVYAKKCMGI